MQTIYTNTVNTDENGYNGFTFVMSFAVAGLTLPAGAITQIRFTFQAGSTEALTITNAYVEHVAGAGDAYDFAATPVQLLWAGAASKVITANTNATTDWANFHYNKTSDLLCAFYMGGGVGSDMSRYKTAVSNVSRYNKSANDAATVNKTGYTLNVGILDSIIKIEVMTSSGGVIFI
jgi:hypothetical protein